MRFYITTPIYYVNDTPHIGHAYTTVVADVLSRFHRLFGDETLFLTGTDEHGQKVQNAAKARDLDPQAHVDELVLHFKEVWNELHISNDLFIRTTEDYHKTSVQQCLQTLFDKGEIYAKDYEGWYSVSEEIFYTEKDLVDGKSPEGKEVQKITERNYFFKMSNYQERLIQYINDNPEFIQPDGKRSEVLGFLDKPLNDLCISRPKSRLSWGVELPFDSGFVTYVWFDALLNYATALGYPSERSKFDQWWPEARHLIGKDILITHAVYWPCMLMALETPLPKQIFAHGWWLTPDNKKMSKSEGPVVKPLDMKDTVGVDAFRYFLVRDIVLGNDGQFSQDLVISRVNSELANNLGNLLSRTLNLGIKYFDSRIPAQGTPCKESLALMELCSNTPQTVREKIDAMELSLALEAIVKLLTETNRYLDTMAPWKTAKENLALAAETIYTALEVLRVVGVLLSPVMPTKCATLLEQLGCQISQDFKWGGVQPGTPISKPEPLFPKVE